MTGYNPGLVNPDKHFMTRALELSERGRYSTSPNPMVGCVIVAGETLIGEGFHSRAGAAHAEVEALRACSASPAGATAYVTLEPCSHAGRTGPCVDALLQAGIRRAVVALRDPDPRVDGAGLQRLRDAGVDVELGVGEEEARRINEKYLHAQLHQRPFVLIKAGMTLDGKLATVTGQSRWITSQTSRQRSLALREEYDAILVGAGTVITDNPRLSRRLGLNHSITPWTRAVVDARGSIPHSSKILRDQDATILFTGRPDAYAGVRKEIVPVPAEEGRVDLAIVLHELFRRGIRSVLAEGGSLLHSDLVRRKLWQKMMLFVAPMIVGGATAPAIFGGEGVRDLGQAERFQFDQVERVGDDFLLTLYP